MAFVKNVVGAVVVAGAGALAWQATVTQVLALRLQTEAAWGSKLDAAMAECMARETGRQEAVRDLMAGRVQLAEAARRWAAIATGPGAVSPAGVQLQARLVVEEIEHGEIWAEGREAVLARIRPELSALVSPADSSQPTS